MITREKVTKKIHVTITEVAGARWEADEKSFVTFDYMISSE